MGLFGYNRIDEANSKELELLNKENRELRDTVDRKNCIEKELLKMADKRSAKLVLSEYRIEILESRLKDAQNHIRELRDYVNDLRRLPPKQDKEALDA